MAVPMLTLEVVDERVSTAPVPGPVANHGPNHGPSQGPDHGPAFRAMLAELGLDVGRLLRIMVALGDPRPRSDLALVLAGQITGRFAVPPEMLCLLRALECLQPMLALVGGPEATVPSNGSAGGAWNAAAGLV